MVRSHRLLSLDLHTYVHADGSRHSRLISPLVCRMKVRSLVGLKSVPSTRDFNYLFLVLLSLMLRLSSVSLVSYLEKLTQVVPNVHLPAQSPDFNDGLAQEVIALTFEPLLHARLDVVVLVPHTNLDAVGRVVAFTGRGRDKRVLSNVMQRGKS